MALKVTEVIHANYELDLLEAHLHEASKYADRIVIKEGECDWHGLEKPLHISNNWNRFAKYPKAELMVIPADFFFKNPSNIQEMRINETGTRQYGWQEVSKGADYVIECDVDEILDASRIDKLFELMEPKEYLHIAVNYANHIWYLNNKTKRHTEYRVFKTGEPEICLYPKGRPRTSTPIIGWHFSGCVKDLTLKYKNMSYIYGYSRTEVETIDWAKLQAERKSLDKHRKLKELDGAYELDIDLNDYPEFIRENYERFPWYGDVSFRVGSQYVQPHAHLRKD